MDYEKRKLICRLLIKRSMPKRSIAMETASHADDSGSVPSKQDTKQKKTVKKAKTAEVSRGVSPEGEAPTKAVKKARVEKPFVPSGPVYDESMRPPPPSQASTRLISWNVAGLRAIIRKDPQAFSKLAAREQLDVICVQEIKMSESNVAEVEASLNLPGWHAVWNCSTAKAGYSGTATFSKNKSLETIKGIGHAEFDGEGRVVATEYDGFWVVNTYVPNSGATLGRLSDRTLGWDTAFGAFCKDLEARGKPVIITGDLNCAHKEIDLFSPKTNLKSAGFTMEERNSFQACLIDVGFVDTYRKQYPSVIGYTYYSLRTKARESGKGWRVDYFLVSECLVSRCHDSFLLKDVEGSDHVPLGLVLLM